MTMFWRLGPSLWRFRADMANGCFGQFRAKLADVETISPTWGFPLILGELSPIRAFRFHTLTTCGSARRLSTRGRSRVRTDRGSGTDFSRRPSQGCLDLIFTFAESSCALFAAFSQLHKRGDILWMTGCLADCLSGGQGTCWRAVRLALVGVSSCFSS